MPIRKSPGTCWGGSACTVWTVFLNPLNSEAQDGHDARWALKAVVMSLGVSSSRVSVNLFWQSVQFINATLGFEK